MIKTAFQIPQHVAIRIYSCTPPQIVAKLRRRWRRLRMRLSGQAGKKSIIQEVRSIGHRTHHNTRPSPRLNRTHSNGVLDPRAHSRTFARRADTLRRCRRRGRCRRRQDLPAVRPAREAPRLHREGGAGAAGPHGAQVGRPWLAAVLASGLPRLPQEVTVRLRFEDFCTSSERLAWAKANGHDLWKRGESFCAFAARRGHLEALQWARANGCPWNEYCRR